ncbi:MAG: hypothetical protein ACW963_10005 [Candidatus Sifarchaeia archaeon]|jgi:hypothetical protein
MTTIFKKLNLKDEVEIIVINSPASFEAELAKLSNVSVVRELAKVSDISFSLSFVTGQEELNAIASEVVAKAKGDATVWFAYPKKSSKRYKCELNRDAGWEVLGAACFEGVRQVAIDDDWSAIRFRRVEFIKSMKRNPRGALSDEGRKRTSSR